MATMETDLGYVEGATRLATGWRKLQSFLTQVKVQKIDGNEDQVQISEKDWNDLNVLVFGKK